MGITKKILGSLCILTMFSSLAFGQTGKIAGRITDSDNGDELIGATVLVMGTTLGASTDFDGNYNILNVPPGVYSIRVSYIGYGSQIISNVRVNIGLTARIDVKLVPETISLGAEVVVTAERPMVQKDLTASTAIISGDQIANLPVTEVSQVVALQAGNVNGHFRGGRSGEVMYMIDGVPVTDKFDGSQVVEVNKNMVSELQVISGAFNAEYGQAMSAIVNVATKDGGNNLDGSVTTYFGDYMTTNDDIFLRPSFYNPLNIMNYEATLSGPILKDDLYFFAVARFVTFGGHLYGKRVYNPENIAYVDSAGNFVPHRFESGKGDGDVVPMNNSSKLYFQNKLTWPILSNVKATLNTIYDYSTSKGYNRNYKYNPDGIRNNYSNSVTGITSVTHTVTANTFYSVSASLFHKKLSSYVHENPFAENTWVHPILNQTYPYNFSTGGQDMGQFFRTAMSGNLKFDLLSQVDNVHQIKTGLEFKMHYMNFKSQSVLPTTFFENFDPKSAPSPFIQTRIDGLDGLSYSYYEKEPYEFSAYIQDKMEFNNFILNIGVRFDYFNPNSQVLSDPSDPNIYAPIKPVNRYNDLDGDGVISGGEQNDNNLKTFAQRKTYWYKDAKPKFKFSPRIGAAFPITDRGKIHFSYGHFYQFPNFDLLYQNAQFKLGQGEGNLGVIGNADLEPEENVSVELGLQQQISDNNSIEATVYFRDYRNLSGTNADEINIFGGGSYNKFVNSDFAFIRGFILTFNQRVSDGLSTSLDYTYQIAKGTASDPSSARNAKAGGQLPEVILVPLDWDQTHTVNATASYTASNWGASTIVTFGSGQPYTPRQTGDIITILRNNEIRPSTFNVDVRGYYDIPLPVGRMTVFARIYNVFDTLNEYGVYNDSGRASYTIYKEQARLQNAAAYVNTLDDFFTDPTMYSEPRRFEFGLTYNF